jgi:predicted dienelactone hydrolase
MFVSLSKCRLASAIFVLTLGCGLGNADTGFISVPGADAPELAARGAFSVGVRTIQLVHSGQVDILHYDKSTGKAPLYDRPLTVEVWYPATIPAGEKEETTYFMPVPGGYGFNGSPTFPIRDKALRDAPPIKGQQFPLVIVSHGYPGSRYLLSYLTGNLASKGYVVAAIDHTDSVYESVRGFESTLLNRSNDQLFTMRSIGELAEQPDSFLHGLADSSNVAIVGYSMGGYGALTSAGAGYSLNGAIAKSVPGDYLQNWMAASAAFQSLDRSRIKAIVAIAPWGEQPPYSAWDAQGLAGIRIPSLFIAGDQDDVADYAHGIKPAFEQSINSQRCLLVYDAARHNTGGNPAPADFILPFSILQSFEEPVWRKERITEVNQHFITAFLDVYLKKDARESSFLHVHPVRSNDGIWPVRANERDTGAYSTGSDAGPDTFWKGFQRRFALGMEMHCMDAGQAHE